jgi:N-acyl homoserine lactone hydrolase
MEQIHVFETGTLTANRTFLRGEGWSSLLRRPEPITFPALAFVIEHPEGLFVLDTGLGAHVARPRQLRGFPPTPRTTGAQELGPQMEERGLDPRSVRRVVLTHLDWDHTGGLHHFPDAEVLVHRPEYEFSSTLPGRLRCAPGDVWPTGFKPGLYDLRDGPFGPFPRSHVLDRAGDLRAVPVPGHSPGQVAVAWDRGATLALFSADHVLRADWFVEDLAAGRHVMQGVFGKAEARQTTARIGQLLAERRVLLLPSHDADAERRVRDGETTVLAEAPEAAGVLS